MKYLAALAILFFATPALAQLTGLPGIESSAVIRVYVTQSSPNNSLQMKLISPILDLRESLISWHVNNELLVEGRGVTDAAVPIPQTGTALDIAASIVTPDGDTAYAYFSFTPAAVDLLWEADGYTPPFYKGRTLPGVGAAVTFVAQPTFIGSEGRLADKDLMYTWRRGERVLGSSSGKGKSSLTLRDPLLGAETITVDVRTPDGALSARSSVRLPEPATQLRLYENHPLFGTIFHTALSATAFTTESEMTFQVIPYFAPARSIDDGTLTYEWRVNQRPVALNASKPSQITINAEGSDGIALIELDLGHTSNYFFGENAAWQMTFSSDTSAVSENPFAPQQ